MNERIEAMEKEMAEQKRKYEEQVEEMKEELRRKELEVKNKEEENRNIGLKNVAETSPPLIKRVVVVDINDENEGQVSTTHNGMLVNADGTLSRTPPV